MIWHLVTRADWDTDAGQPYRAVSLHSEGFIHCSADVATTLAVANAFYRDPAAGLVALQIDESRLTAMVEWEAPAPAPPPGVADDVLFPHVFGPIDRAAVTDVRTVQWSADGQAIALT